MIEEKIRAADKVLFITHLAIGDFTYLSNYFRAFKSQYPNTEIHLWVDELRRTRRSSRWPSLKRYVLYDWLNRCAFVDRVYSETYSPDALEASIAEAQTQKYPVVVSLATLRPYFYAKLARTISQDGFLLGLKKKPKFFAWHQKRAYELLDEVFPSFKYGVGTSHVTDMYSHWFEYLGVPPLDQEERFPVLEIPAEWQDYATQKLNEWGVGDDARKIVFINPFAKTPKRTWPVVHVVETIRLLREQPDWSNVFFIVNSMPERMDEVRELLQGEGLSDVIVFSADENFFQLPAILSRCHLILSVETAVMHLANAVGVFVVALMRQKNPEWVPINRSLSRVVLTQKRSEWVKDISPSRVVEAILEHD
jgi:ADP-heptose:LPS heptosyltransferase